MLADRDGGREAGRGSIATLVADSLRSPRGRALIAIGAVLLVLSAVLHANVWHLVAAAVFAASLWALSSPVAVARTLPRRLFATYARWVDRLSLAALVAATYATFTIVAVKGALVWVPLSLVGLLALLWVVFDTLIVFQRRVARTVLHLLVGWSGVAALRPVLASAPLHGATAVIGIGLALSLYVVFAEVRRVPEGWAPWRQAYLALAAVPAWKMLGDLLEQVAERL